MELQTIRQVSLDYGVSRRMLCYYEEIGLIKSSRKDGYAYRVYDEDAINRLQQIIILRKLQIPIKQIKDILNNQNAVAVIEIFKKNISELDEEITALSAVKSILMQFVTELQEKADVHLKLDLLSHKDMLTVVETLSFTKHKIEEKITMDDLNKANNTLNKLEDKDVRIVYLPPMTVAAAYFSGEAEYGVGPEATSMIEKFVWESGLLKIKPDARGMGFDCSRENLKVKVGVTPTAYEAWVSIPYDMEVKAPLIKKTFNGGLYAAHKLRDWSFEDWRLLTEWVNSSEKYEEADGPCFEEILNYYNLMQEGAQMDDTQLDLLLPVKKKKTE